MLATDVARIARWEAHHEKPEKWFWSRVDQSGGAAACWPWTGRVMRTRGGYGRLTFRGRMIGAHRMALVIFSGSDREGYQACHRCDNPICCNPAHLWWGTVRDNAVDAFAKGRRLGAPPKIDLAECLRLRAEGKSYSAIASALSVNQASVGKALKRAALRARAGEMEE